MNAKTCKRARRLAQKLSTGLPARNLVFYGTNRTTAVNDKKSTRGVYRFIKGLIRNAGATMADIEKANEHVNAKTTA